MIYNVQLFWSPEENLSAQVSGSEKLTYWVNVRTTNGGRGYVTIFVPSSAAAEKLASVINEICAEPVTEAVQ